MGCRRCEVHSLTGPTGPEAESVFAVADSGRAEIGRMMSADLGYVVKLPWPTHRYGEVIGKCEGLYAIPITCNMAHTKGRPWQRQHQLVASRSGVLADQPRAPAFCLPARAWVALSAAILPIAKNRHKTIKPLPRPISVCPAASMPSRAQSRTATVTRLAAPNADFAQISKYRFGARLAVASWRGTSASKARVLRAIGNLNKPTRGICRLKRCSSKPCSAAGAATYSNA